MRIRELIAKLKEFPEDSFILIDNNDGNNWEISDIKKGMINYIPKKDTKYYENKDVFIRTKKLRFKIDDFVETKSGSVCRIIGYNHHCGGQDYSINFINEWSSACYGLDDEEIIGLYKVQDLEEIREEIRNRKINKNS